MPAKDVLKWWLEVTAAVAGILGFAITVGRVLV